jgi:hypothetical protein
MSGFELDYDFSLTVEAFRDFHRMSYRTLYAAALREYMDKHNGSKPDTVALPNNGGTEEL